MTASEFALSDLAARLLGTDASLSTALRDIVAAALQDLIEAELTATIGAAPGERTPERVAQRNGHRPKVISTPAGDVEVAIPKLRTGSFFPELLEPRRRIDRALWAVIMTAYITGTSTRKVDDLVKALGCDTGISKSSVSRICAQIDADVAVLRTRRLDHQPFVYVWLDATYVHVRENRQVVSKAIVIATGLRADGHREVLGIDVGDSENETFWREFLTSLVDRGLAGVRLVISDAHAGLIKAIRRCFQGAGWQRCRVHAMRNLLAAAHHRHRQVIAALIRTIFVQPDNATATAQLRAVVEQLRPYAPSVADRLEAMEADLLAYTAFPVGHWSNACSIAFAVLVGDEDAGAAGDGSTGACLRGFSISVPPRRSQAGRCRLIEARSSSRIGAQRPVAFSISDKEHTMGWVVGLDVHKDTIAAAVLRPTGEVAAEARFDNTERGHAELHAWITTNAARPCCGLEPSGGVGHAAAAYLQRAGTDVVLVPSRLSAREATKNRRRGKTDAGDAVAIARVVQREERLPAFCSGGAHEDLRLLVDYRDQLHHERTRVCNRLHADLAIAYPGYQRGIGKALTSRRALAKVEELLAGDHSVRAGLDRQRLARLREIDAELKQVVIQLEALVEATGSTLTNIVGISTVIAARLLGEIGDIHRFPTSSAFAAGNGTAPLDASSGRNERHRLNRGGNRRVNRALYTIALTQTRHEPRAIDYLARKRAAGHTRRGALRCLKRRLSDVVYRTMRDDAARLAT